MSGPATGRADQEERANEVWTLHRQDHRQVPAQGMAHDMEGTVVTDGRGDVLSHAGNRVGALRLR
jgi:hypothetical protein